MDGKIISEMILAFIGKTALLLGAVYFLSRLLIKHRLEKDLEDFRDSLKKKAFEREIVFSRIHEKRMFVLEEVYQKLILVKKVSNGLISPFRFGGEPSIDEQRKKLSDAVEEYMDAFNRNKIWLDQDLVSKLSIFFDEMMVPLKEFLIAKDIADEDRDGSSQKEKIKAWKKVVEDFRDKVPKGLVDIENEFRRLLGVMDK